MADKIKKLRVKQATGNFSDDIPLGADAANVDLANGQTVEQNLQYVNTELIRAEDTGSEVPAASFSLPIASNLVLGGIKVGEDFSIDENGILSLNGIDYNKINNKPNFATVATSGDYNDLINKPTIPTQYVLPIASDNKLGGVRIGTGINIDATGTISVKQGVTDYNDLVNKPTIPEPYNLPTASVSEKGGITVDGTLLAIEGTTLTAPGYLLLTGGTLKGDLRLYSEGALYGNSLFFGDSDYCYLKEDSDNVLTIYSENDIILSKKNQSSTTKETLSLTQLLEMVGNNLYTATGSYTGTGKTNTQLIEVGFIPDYVAVFSDKFPEGNTAYLDEYPVSFIESFSTGDHSNLSLQAGYQQMIAGSSYEYQSYEYNDITVYSNVAAVGYTGNGFKISNNLNIENAVYCWFAIGKDIATL